MKLRVYGLQLEATKFGDFSEFSGLGLQVQRV